MSVDRRSEPRTAVVCRRLRTKTAFGTLVGDTTEVEPWFTGASTTAVYWCLATMASCGPDDALAHPHSCREGRECFRSPED